jgi:hypothetical protein
MNAFGSEVLRLSIDLVPVLLAIPLVRVVRGPAQATLVVLNLWLIMELLTALVGGPDYRFGDLMLPRLVASVLHTALAFGAIELWRRWRIWSGSVTVH